MIKRYTSLEAFLIVFALLLTSTALATGAKLTEVAFILLEARDAAATVKDSIERTYALEHVLSSQISLDPLGALTSLKLFPDLPNNSNHLVSLGFRYAKVGDVQAAEEIYVELSKRKTSDQRDKLTSANALGHVALAYANAAKLEEASRRLAELKNKYEGENFAIVSDATARVAEARAKHGDLAGAIELAKSVAGDNPYPLMNIIGGRVRADNLPEALRIISGFDEWLQPYAKWGIVSAQRELGELRAAQNTASTIKPGHAKASAFLELANHYVKMGDKSTALRLVQEAATAAPSTMNVWTRADILWRVAASMANAGDAKHALEIAKSIEKAGHRRFAIRDIVKAQAEQNKFKEAFGTALLLKDVDESDHYGANAYVQSISEILAQLVKSGRAKEALETVPHFDDLNPQRRSLYGAVAAAQANAGDIDGARSTLSLAETEGQRAARRKEMARLVPLVNEDSEELRQLRALQRTEDESRMALEAIALAHARRGEIVEASTIAFDLDFHYREELLGAIGKVTVESGRNTQALAWGRSLPSPSDRSYALVEIAGALNASMTKTNSVQ